LKDHPNADKSKHTVGKPGGGSQGADTPDLTGAAHKAKARSDATTKTYDAFKALRKKMESGGGSDPEAAEKKLRQVYDKLFQGGEAAAKDAEKLLKHKFPEGSDAESAAEILARSVHDWERNKSDHVRGKTKFAPEMAPHAEQTWAYAKKIDDQIAMLSKAVSGGSE
jgi:hypothetical protein